MRLRSNPAFAREKRTFRSVKFAVEVKSVLVVNGDSESRARGRSVSVPALEHVANRPILHHVLDSLRDVSTDGVIFAGEADVLLDVRASLTGYEPKVPRTDYVVCPAAAGIGRLLESVSGLVGSAGCLIQPADGMLEEPVVTLFDQLHTAPFDTLLLVAGGAISRRPRWWSVGGEMTTAIGDTELLGVGVFGPGALTRVSAQLDSAGDGEIAWSEQQLLSGAAGFELHPVGSWHRYSGHGGDLLELNRIVLDRIVGNVPESIRASNRIEGRVVIDPSVEIRSSVVVGPVVIGPYATIRDAYLGPYTSIGAGVQIEGAEIERSIISPGASVHHIGSRLISSIVGRDTRVFRDLSLPRAVRLWTGDGDEVALC
jgi:glucose-1-phosphate thymidylyltransferase